MVQFNLLESSLVFNSTTVTGTQYLFTSDDVSKLINEPNANISISGAEFGLDIDLKTQTSLFQIQYQNNPLNLSNVEISYGRDLNDMFIATPVVSGSYIVVEPTESGYTEPRYIIIKDSFLSSSGVVEQINILNSDTEVIFNNPVVTLVGDITESTSDTIEIPITNSGVIPADIYVSIDPRATPSEVSNLELSLTPTGNFSVFNEALTVPDSIPWELGALNNLRVNNNTLGFNNPINFDNLAIGSIIEFPGNSVTDSLARGNLIEITDVDGSTKLARSSSNYSIQIIDPFFGTRRSSPVPNIHPPPTGSEASNTKVAWDGGDYLYYLTGQASQEIHRYSISQNTFELFTTVSGFFNRNSKGVEIYNNELYVLGGQSTAGSSSSTGNQLWKINLNTKVETRLTDFIGTFTTLGFFTTLFENYIYVVSYTSGTNFFRYNINLDFWEILPNAPLPSFTVPLGLSPDPTNNRVLYYRTRPSNSSTSDDVTVHGFSTLSNTFGVITTFNNAFPTLNNIRLATSSFNGSLISVEALNNTFASSNLGRSKLIGALPSFPLAATSGTWTSPVFKIEQSDEFLYYEPYLDYNRQEGVSVKAVPSLSSESIEIRGSNIEPSADNSLQFFRESLDPLEFFILNQDGSLATTSGGNLILSHQPGGDDFNTSSVTFGFPLSTNGVMQYSFSYSPATDKLAGSSHLSKFYIAPFTDVLGTGIVPERDSQTLARTSGDSLYLEFGSSSDSGGNLTSIRFFNGSTSNGTSVNLVSGTFYQFNIVIDWTQGTYKVLLNSEVVLNGTISFVQINKLVPEHTYEFFSAAQDVSSNEKYKQFYVSRVGNPPLEDSLFTPYVVDDTTFGNNGLTFNVVTLNNPVIPKTEYLQLKLSLQSDGSAEDLPVIEKIRFPRVLVLNNMQPGETRSVYARYNFPETQQSGSSTIYLKTWMRTDKQ